MTEMEVVTTAEFGPEVQLVTLFDTAERSMYSLNTDHAGADSIYHKETHVYDIELIRVSVNDRQQGFGREMLQVLVKHARSLRADAIRGTILSREGLALITGVFGEDAISVVETGEFAEKGQERNEDNPADAQFRVQL